MPFQEKSAWVMSLALLMGSVFYFVVVAAMSSDISQLAPPTLPVVAIFTVILIVVAILGHVAIAIFSPKDASEPLDEREREKFFIERVTFQATYLG
jgi:purine-cytosine permease-like protein